MLPNSISSIVGPNGQPIRTIAKANPNREYTAAGGASRYGIINNGSDLERLHGSVEDLDLRLGWDAKEQMDNDPFCGSHLDTMMLGALPRPAQVVPAPENSYASDAEAAMSLEMAQFGVRVLGYLRETNRDIRSIAFSRGRSALKIGHSKAEIVRRTITTGPDAGKSVIDRIKAKNRHNSCFLVDRQMNLAGIAAFTGEYSSYADPYKQTNISGVMRAGELSAGWEELPRDKWLVMTNRPGDDDSPLGTSAYRRAYTAYRMKRDTWAYYLKSLDFTALPFMVGEEPEHEYNQSVYPLDETGAPDETQERVSMSAAMYDGIIKGRQGGVAVIPHSAKIHSIYNAASGDPFATARNVFNSEITMSIMLQQLATGTDRHMARAAGEVHQDILDLAMKSVRADVTNDLNRDVWIPLFKDNFPSRYWHLIPSLSFGEVELNDFAAWAKAFSDLANSGLLYPSQFSYICQVLGLPQPDMEEVWDQIDADSALDESLMQPEEKVNPDGTVTQGPSQMNLQLKGEYSKRVSRNIGKRRAGRAGGMIA